MSTRFPAPSNQYHLKHTNHDLVHAFLCQDWDVGLGLDAPEECSHDAFAVQEFIRRQADMLAVILHPQNDRLAIPLRRTQQPGRINGIILTRCIFFTSQATQST